MSHLLPNEMRSDRTEDLKYSDVLPTEEKLKVVQHMLYWENTYSEY